MKSKLLDLLGLNPELTQREKRRLELRDRINKREEATHEKNPVTGKTYLDEKQTAYEICVRLDQASFVLPNVSKRVKKDQNYTFGRSGGLFMEVPDEVGLYLSLAKQNFRDGNISEDEFQIFHNMFGVVGDYLFKQKNPSKEYSKRTGFLIRELVYNHLKKNPDISKITCDLALPYEKGKVA